MVISIVYLSSNLMLNAYQMVPNLQFRLRSSKLEDGLDPRLAIDVPSGDVVTSERPGVE